LRDDIVTGEVWQIQQAIRFVESKSLLDAGAFCAISVLRIGDRDRR
jgi:hypothetical protein